VVDGLEGLHARLDPDDLGVGGVPDPPEHVARGAEDQGDLLVAGSGDGHCHVLGAQGQATIATLVLLHRANAARPRRAAMLLLAAVLIQGVIGYAQYLDGLPIWLVTLHMVGITLITLTASLLLFTTRRAVA